MSFGKLMSFLPKSRRSSLDNEPVSFPPDAPTTLRHSLSKYRFVVAGS